MQSAVVVLCASEVCLCLCAEPLEFGRDLNAARYKDGQRETPNAQVSSMHIAATIMTCQMHKTF